MFGLALRVQMRSGCWTSLLIPIFFVCVSTPAFDSIGSPESFMLKRVKQLNAEQQTKYGPDDAERRLLEVDIFDEGRIPFLKSELAA